MWVPMITPPGPNTMVEPSACVIVVEAVPIGNVVPPITMSVTEEGLVGIELVGLVLVGLVLVGIEFGGLVLGGFVLVGLELGGLELGGLELGVVDLLVTFVVGFTVMGGTSTGLNGGQVVGILITSPGKMRSGFAICLLCSKRQ